MLTRTRSERNHSEASYPPSKRRRVSGNNEDIFRNKGSENQTARPSASTNIIVSSQAAPAAAPTNTTRELSEWHIPEVLSGEVYYIPDFVDKETANQWLLELMKLDTWYHPQLKVYGKEVSQSRSIAAYAFDAGVTVKYSGHVVMMHYSYPPLLTEIQKRVEDLLGETFSHVMLNRYEDGREYIGKHRDTKENKIIVSLSLGAERTFIMTPSKTAFNAKTHRWKLANGSLLVMKGETQDNWKHEIPKEPKIKDERISLTFRQLVSSESAEPSQHQ